MGLAGLLSQSIQNHRLKEMKSANGYRWLVLLTNMTGYTPQIFAPVLTFVAYEIKAQIQGSNSLSTNQAITSLATITLLTTPASTFLTAIPETVAAIGCFERIQKFLIAPSWEDSRVGLRKPRPSSEPSSPSQAGASIKLNQLRADGQDPSPWASQAADQPAISVKGLTARPSLTAEPAITRY